MPPPTKARTLAPLALFAVMVLVAVVVMAGGHQDERETFAPVATTAVKPVGPRTYVVRRGDALAAIAVRFKVSLQSVIDLNPRVDPQSVSIGTRLKLR